MNNHKFYVVYYPRIEEFKFLAIPDYHLIYATIEEYLEMDSSALIELYPEQIKNYTQFTFITLPNYE